MQHSTLTTGVTFNQEGDGYKQQISSLVPLFRRRVQNGVAEPLPVSLSVGDHHLAVVASSGELYTVGSQERGAVGRPSHTNRLSRVDSLESHHIVDVACGADFTIAVSSAGLLFAWGEGGTGQLAHGTRDSSSKPKRVRGELSSRRVVAVSAGRSHVIALCATGELFGWGDGFCGVGDIVGSLVPRLVTPLFGVPIAQIACGVDFSVALSRSGSVYTWGSNRCGQLGVGTKDVLRPQLVRALEGRKITKVATGEQHALALSSLAAVYSWGLNSSGQLGREGDHGTPSPIFLGETVVDISANRKHSYFLTGEGRVLCVPEASSEAQMHARRMFAGKDALFLLQGSDIPPAPYRGVDVYSESDALDVDRIFTSPAAVLGSFASDYDSSVRAMQRVISHGTAQEQNQLGVAWSKLIRNHLPLVNFKFPETLALVVHAFLNPWLQHPGHYHVITSNLLDGLQARRKDEQRAISRTLAELPTQHFQTVVSVVKEHLCYLLRHSIDAVSTARFQHQLWEANEGRLAPEFFYNETLANVINLRKEYIMWMQRSSVFTWLDYPYLLPPSAKAALVRLDSHVRMEQQAVSQIMTLKEPFTTILVHRESIVKDVFSALAPLGSTQLKRPLRVTFAGEEGVDQGGLTKEMMLLLVGELLNANLGLFVRHESGLYHVNGLSLEANIEYELVGMLLGLAIYNSVLLPLAFPPFFWRHLLKGTEEPRLEDLSRLDPTLASGLQKLLDYDGDDHEDVFGLNMAVSFSYFGETRTHEFVANGAEIPVDSQRAAKRYVDAYVRWVIQDRVASQMEALRNGFLRVCDSPIFELLTPRELELLVVGASLPDLDFSILRHHASYVGYTSSSPTIELFWKVVEAFSMEEKRAFLKFFSSSPLVPIEGLKGVPLKIQKSGTDTQRLPVAHTCFNMVDLPPYADEETLRAKLLYAISASSGFNLV